MAANAALTLASVSAIFIFNFALEIAFSTSLLETVSVFLGLATSGLFLGLTTSGLFLGFGRGLARSSA